MIWGFPQEVAKKFSLLGYYAASSGNLLRYLNLGWQVPNFIGGYECS